jgi:Xaa-Pro aminopeptidase
MKTRAVSAILLTKNANVTYLSGFLGEDSWLMLTMRSAYLLTDSRYSEQAAEQCKGCKIIERTEAMTKAVAQLLAKHNAIKCLAVENSISLAQMKALRKSVKGHIKPVAGVVENIRRTKDNDEAGAIKRAARIAGEALRKSIRRIKPGITESELAGIIEFEMRRLGATASFETIVAFGANASRPHHCSSRKKLRQRNSVLIDFGAKLDGYCCDITRCFPVGKPGRLFEKVYKAVHEAQRAAIAAIKAGVTCKAVDEAARGVIREHGFEPHGHGTGHGLGLELHELPIVGPQSKDKLQAGDVITIEPGIYIPGRLGIRIEDDILVTRTGSLILSDSISKCLEKTL